ncbi:hypothetical protein KSS87_002509 [Heliosperma pusillum]|nr:hypothetical protein KSS87_002509 [Heliosperma pusillum]
MMEKGGSRVDVEDGGCGSLSSSFKRKVLVTESSSIKDTLYEGDDPFGKRARYKYPEDSEVVQNMYGLTTHAELVGLIESTRENHDDIVSPNLRFTYGVNPYARDSDPRIGDMAKLKEQTLHMARANDRAALMIGRTSMSMRRRRPASYYFSSSHLIVIDPNSKPKCDQEEIWRKRYEKWEEQEQELLHARDLRMSTRALACFNLKFKTDYMVEQVLGSQKIDLEQGCFFHCNFIARSKTGSQQHLFFAEITNAVAVTLCCILDDGVRGCRFCGDEFVHPSEEGLQSVG